MAWTYDPTDLDTSTAGGRLNSVRLLIGDTQTQDQQLQDEEIQFGLSENVDNVYSTSVWCANTLASKFARLVDVELDGALSQKYSSLSSQYRSLATSLSQQAPKGKVELGVAAGGISKSEMSSVRANTDRVQGSFRRDRFHNPPNNG